MIFACDNIKKGYGADEILLSVSFMLEDGEKAAVVGVNGAGKTTLFRIITGELPTDGGDLTFKKNAAVGYLSQTQNFNPVNTVYDELLTVFAPLIALEADMRQIELEMRDSQGPALDNLLQKYEKSTAEFELKKGYSYKSLTRGVIKGLGFTEEETKLPLGSLSGGQRTRVELGKLLLQEPDLLLLDEPTNHLDIDAVGWLEDYLKKSFPGSVLIISHDRFFLDGVATKVIEIERGESKVYHGNYSSYAFQKVVDREQQIKRYVNQQREIKRQEEIIRRYRSYAQEWSIKKAKTREKMLQKVERLELPKEDRKVRILLEPKQQSGNDVLHAEGLAMAFREPLFENVNLDIKRGEVVALIGPNGVGKTTLFNMLLGKLRGKGLIRLGAGVRIGYYDQEQKLIADDKTIFDEIYDAYPAMSQTDIRTALAAFMFCGDDVFKRIGALSGGEKGRVSLAKLMLGYANFLLLDEPTNHLDIFSREILEEAIRNYTGTILYISHDRYFINATADRVAELSPFGLTSYDGGYDYYLEKKAMEIAANGGDNRKQAPDSSAKADWLRKKDEESRERKRLSRTKKLEEEIARSEDAIKEVNRRLATEEVATNAAMAQEAYAEKVRLEDYVQALYVEWHELVDSNT